ncbi:HofP DNA utilization family protein [Lonsdalea britannica]|uniref:HofP DNA utilization family protein n=1 Tax=Lonsdalea britannica TaxID=1082704 RepID=UPI0026F20E7F|nr:HofP DNA utilization family protein [Lonsdalea britannica]
MARDSGFFNGKTYVALACLSLTLISGDAVPAALTSEDERDPFQPQTAHCVMPASTAQWRLQGLVGDTSRWVGWVKQAGNVWLRVKYDETVPPTDGIVAQLDHAHGMLRLSPLQGDCPVSEIPLSSPFSDWSQGVVP